MPCSHTLYFKPLDVQYKALSNCRWFIRLQKEVMEISDGDSIFV